jgi:uncharacterized protein
VIFALAVVVGLLAGLLGGLFGVGGGILFVPMLLLLGLDQHQAEATSLLAILPVVAVGSWRQSRYGNVHWRAALVLGLGSLAAVVAGAVLAEALPHRTLERLFGALVLVVAAELGWRALRPERSSS